MAKKCIYLFDFDNTLYDPANGLMNELKRRMGLFLAKQLNWTPAEVEERVEKLRVLHGPIITGFMREYPEHKIDVELFSQFVHDFSLPDYLAVDRRLQALLAGLPGDVYILSNGFEEYLDQALALLGIKDLVKGIYGIRFVQFSGKPDPNAYERVIDDIGVDPASVIYFDDNIRDLKPAKKLGMTTVWVSNGQKWQPPKWVDYRLADIYQLSQLDLSC